MYRSLHAIKILAAGLVAEVRPWIEDASVQGAGHLVQHSVGVLLFHPLRLGQGRGRRELAGREMACGIRSCGVGM